MDSHEFGLPIEHQQHETQATAVAIALLEMKNTVGLRDRWHRRIDGKHAHISCASLLRLVASHLVASGPGG